MPNHAMHRIHSSELSTHLERSDNQRPIVDRTTRPSRWVIIDRLRRIISLMSGSGRGYANASERGWYSHGQDKNGREKFRLSSLQCEIPTFDDAWASDKTQGVRNRRPAILILSVTIVRVCAFPTSSARTRPKCFYFTSKLAVSA